MKGIFSIILVLVLCACSSEQGKAPETVEEFSIGRVLSTDLDYLTLDQSLNSWGITTIGERKQIALRVVPGGYYSGESDWTLMIRGDVALLDGISPISLENEAISFRIYRNHSEADICCINTRPYEDFDIASSSHVGVSGFIIPNGSKEGRFEVQVMKETQINSGEVSGQIIQVYGCWKIGGETKESGCEI